MKRKINAQLTGIATVSIFLTLLLVAAVFYHLFRRQIFDDLRIYTRILSHAGFDMESYEERDPRVTLIAPDGTVLYDSDVRAEEMENHKNRSEVAEAFADGEGYAVRKSQTLSHNTYYFAVRLEDGNVLRVSREASSLLNVFGRAMPVICLMVIAFVITCSVAAHLMTKSLLAPIERMAADLDHPEDARIYSELVPFADTIRRQHEDIIKNAQMRQEFTANVSHELKTPLTAISGYSELIENGMVEEEHVVHFAHEIHHNATRLLTLINDTIRLSELDAGAEKCFEPLDLYVLAKNTVDMLQMNADKHGVSLFFSGTQPCMVCGDRQMLEEVLYNLCDNAIRYNNENGSAWVRVYRDGEGRAVLSVKDTGIGIPKEHQERVFERFYRVDKSRSKLSGGTGLGLAIVKHIVAQHGATLTLDSEAGKGTEITICFLAQAQSDEAAQ